MNSQRRFVKKKKTSVRLYSSALFYPDKNNSSLVSRLRYERSGRFFFFSPRPTCGRVSTNHGGAARGRSRARKNHRLHGAPFRGARAPLPGDPVTPNLTQPVRHRRVTVTENRSIWCGGTARSRARATGNRAPNPGEPVKQYPVPAARCAPPPRLPPGPATRVAAAVYNVSYAASSRTLCYGVY